VLNAETSATDVCGIGYNRSLWQEETNIVPAPAINKYFKIFFIILFFIQKIRN
jgi:hypothetical protein